MNEDKKPNTRELIDIMTDWLKGFRSLLDNYYIKSDDMLPEDYETLDRVIAFGENYLNTTTQRTP